MHGANASCGEPLLQCLAGNNQRFAKCIVVDAHVVPSDCFADTRTKCFGKRFLCRKTLGNKASWLMARSVLDDFQLTQDSMQELIAMFGQQRFNARDDDDIGADAMNHSLQSACAGSDKVLLDRRLETKFECVGN